MSPYLATKSIGQDLEKVLNIPKQERAFKIKDLKAWSAKFHGSQGP